MMLLSTLSAPTAPPGITPTSYAVTVVITLAAALTDWDVALVTIACIHLVTQGGARIMVTKHKDAAIRCPQQDGRQ